MQDVLNAPGRFICRTATVITRHLNAIAQDYGITPAEGRTMEFLAAHEGPVIQREIEEEYALRAATASELLQTMENQGLITREQDPEDRRKKIIRITDERRGDAEGMLQRLAEQEERLIAGVAPEKLAIFLEVLQTVLQNAKTL